MSITQFEKIPYTTACKACSDIQARLNAVEKEYNDLVDKVNGMWEDFRQYLIKGGSRGDKEAAELSGNARREGEKFDGLWDRMAKLQKELRACDPSKCTVTEGGGAISIGGGAVKVEIIDTKVRTGNDPYDPRDPIAENSEDIQVGGGGGSGATVQVIDNIPISRLIHASPDVCPEDHYHGAAFDCNGVFKTDPNPGACGHGTSSDVVTIPVSSCPDL